MKSLINSLIKLILIFALPVILINEGCRQNTANKREIYNKDFNWTITIPENFDTVSAKEWAKMQSKGEEAVEKTFEGEIENRAKTIFVFKSDKLNYFESNYQPFDTATDGPYLQSVKNVNEMLYQTFATQMPGSKIDSATSVEKIDNLEFQKLVMKITYPNKMVMNIMMFSRLFDRKEFSVNIMFVDNKKGEQMLNAWKRSKFDKSKNN